MGTVLIGQSLPRSFFPVPPAAGQATRRSFLLRDRRFSLPPSVHPRAALFSFFFFFLLFATLFCILHGYPELEIKSSKRRDETQASRNVEGKVPTRPDNGDGNERCLAPWILQCFARSLRSTMLERFSCTPRFLTLSRGVGERWRTGGRPPIRSLGSGIHSRISPRRSTDCSSTD